MLSRIQRLIGLSLLAVYAGIALVGHGGMHLLHGDSHFHPHAVAESGGHSHGGCCHHHHADEATPESDSGSGGHEHRHDSPAHDHDDCVICQHFAAKACLIAADLPLSFSGGVEHIDCPLPLLISGEDCYVLPIRGPPALSC